MRQVGIVKRGLRLLALAWLLALVPAGAAIAAPSVSITAQPNPVEVGQTVQFTANVTSDPGTTIIEYDWDFGDNSGGCGGCDPTVSYSYGSTGSYTVTLTIYDSNYNVASATTTVEVTPVPQEAAQEGSIRAELFYSVSHGSYNALDIGNERIHITRNGTIAYDSSVPRLGLGCPPCEPIPIDYYGGTAPALSVRDVNGNGEPAVLLTVSNGGNICCRYTILYSYQLQTGSYTPITQDWLDWGGMPPLRDLNDNGVLEWVGADTRFRYAFACGACSSYPIQVWRFTGGRFVDVTRQYPALVAQDARKLYRYYLQQRVVRNGYRDVRGILPAYLADEYLLGRGASGWRVLRAAERGGYLVDDLGILSNLHEPSPAVYLKQVRSFLHRLGYIH